MATHFSKLATAKALTALLSRSFCSLSFASHPLKSSPSLSLSLFNRLRPLAAVNIGRFVTIASPTRGLATRATSSSLNDPNPNWSNRPPKETILLDGCDFEHWLVVMEPPEGNPTRDEIIDSYIKTLAMVIGSEEEARMKIYSVSTRCYFAFGALVSEELSYKIKELPRVRWVLPDSYLDVKNKDYGGEPFINGQAVPYDPKYHEEWIRNNARANERNRRNDRPRNFDRSRNFERRRENMQNRDFQNQGMMNSAPNSAMPPSNSMAPPNNMPSPNMPPSNNMAPPNNMPPNSVGRMPPSNMGGPPNNYGGMSPPSNYGGVPPANSYGGVPPANSYGGVPPANSYGGLPPANNYGGVPPANNYGGVPPANNYGGMPPQPNNTGNMGGMPPNAGGWSSNMPGSVHQNAGPAYHNGPNTQFQNSYNPGGNTNMPGGNQHQH
ncbi:multiple organellar RNA editing factor 8, chloroplastic/mitochondrial-like [Mangifera indica]|uniref:multiple organellar RNA editing factor 8, chloroplastic/mitochondrial-like n=1 Tax=Mangifera indica TaxID=29780 RepID=UPI001CFA1F0D|nr:multiple organellar RNA editing factor 8, chloroplastic/mitochondrial-like [Mangifera indica]